ncbi:MAG: hypothetical protein L6R19_21355 [Alphaproteobacteria bacterium]|nr:hypothetical protein [Alphaproteobacteria bacterium]
MADFLSRDPVARRFAGGNAKRGRASGDGQPGRCAMPLVLRLLGVPLSVVILLMLFGVV